MTVEGKDGEELIPVDPRHNLTLKKRAMVEALECTLGVVTEACAMVGISRWTHYDWMKHDKLYAQMVKEIDEVSLDYVESKNFKNIEKGLEASIIFYLKTKGKRRGFIERTEVDSLAMNIQLGVAEVPQVMNADEWAETAEKYQSRLREIQRRTD